MPKWILAMDLWPTYTVLYGLYSTGTRKQKKHIYIYNGTQREQDTKECLETDVCNMGLSTFTLGEYAIFMPTPMKIFLPVRSRKVNYNCVLFFTRQNIPPEPDGIITVPIVEALGL